MNAGILGRSGLILAAVSALFLTGCGSGVSRTVNVNNGEYYTEEEFAKLSKDQREAYCADLDAELARLESAAASEKGKVSGVQGQLTSVQNEVRQLESQYNSAKGELDGLQKEIDYYEGLPTTHTVVDGEFLQKISEYERIYADPLKWPRIYRANKDKISDPNLIYPGWELAIPRDWPHMHTVKQDEYLSKIAGYWEVYGDPSEWPRIHQANTGQIRDPDIIWPGWELTIPRN